MRQATWEATSPCPPLLLAAGTLARFGETGHWCRGTGHLAAREDVSRRWVERGRREGEERALQGAKAPTDIPHRHLFN